MNDTYPRDLEYRGNKTPLWKVGRVQKFWWFAERYAVFRTFSDRSEYLRRDNKVVYFHEREEAEALTKKMNRTWPETFEYEVGVPLHVCGMISTTHDGIKHFYLSSPYAFWCRNNLGEYHGFYRYPVPEGQHSTNYIGVKNIADAIKLKVAVEYWERHEAAP